MLKKLKNLIRPFIPFYYWGITWLAVLRHGFPAKRLIIIGVTGTKGKSTICEMLYAIFQAAGYKTALASTIRFAYPAHEEPNLFKMTMPGRGYLQGFLARALAAGATHAIVELTSEGMRQFRSSFLFLDGLVVTGIEREHIESHGSFEKYIAAKRAIVAELERSPKKNKVLVVNGDNEYTKRFLDARVPTKKTFARGALGDFNMANARAAITMAEALGISKMVSEKALATMPRVLGRVEPIERGQPFTVIVDYAHTPDSLKALYAAFAGKRKVCVLGNTGGGRDSWKRPEMGAIADRECDTVILTDEDPYDEDPRAIIEAMTKGMKRKPEIIMDRRLAIREAIRLASLAQAAGDENIAVLITGKGTDPYIMGPRGERALWNDAAVAGEELEKLVVH
jgi:UDP-N-acetylmuramoyl-L-alanyl-D-glutamate--2,6-diaminopimelate ligase